MLDALAGQMVEPAEQPGGGTWGGSEAPPTDLDHPTLPAAYTYFGQFVDHDITFDPVSSLDRQNDPDALNNFRSPRFDLDSLYGSGPADEPFQYQRGSNGLKFLIGDNGHGELDLPRNTEGTALIGDSRNDENVIVSQLQLVFLRLHNKLADEVSTDGSVPEDERFRETQKRVRFHYQWVVINDFLRRIVNAELLDSLFKIENGEPEFSLRYFRPKHNPFMPVEFSAAAYRFGHSMIRPLYDLSGNVTARPIFIPGDQVGEFDDLRGFRRLPQQWTIDWKFFLPIEGANPQLVRKIDTKLAAGLSDLPGLEFSLAKRNLRRGQALGLPSGQDVARLLGEEPIPDAELEAPEPSPLWFYLLKEAERGGGERLGPVGGRIVAEVLLGLLRDDPAAWVNLEPDWTPTVASAGDQFTLADLVAFATS